MIYLYEFEDSGWCKAITGFADTEAAMFFVEGTNCQSYILSSQSIPLENARLVDGELVVDTKTKSFEVLCQEAKTKRKELLLRSDWTDTASAPVRLGEALYTAWQVYRQALRDVPTQPSYPQEVVWPNPPA